MGGIPKEIYRLFRKVRDLFIATVFPTEGIFKAKFLQFVVGGISDGKFDFSDLVSGNDLNKFYKQFRDVRNKYVDDRIGEISKDLGEALDKETLKKMPEWFMDYVAAKERLLQKLSDLDSFIELPPDIRKEYFESSKGLREHLLERLIPIALEELGVDESKIQDFRSNKDKRREFYSETLFPKVIVDAKSVGLSFDRKLIWSVADRIINS